VATLAFGASPATAADFRIQSTTIGDFYGHLRSDGEEIERRRLHQLLGLSVFDIGGDGSNDIFFVSSFRFDSDFGIVRDELDRVAQLDREQVAILYAYLEVRDLFDFLSIKAGRQFEIDAVDMLLYDGLELRFDTPWYFGVEALVGVEARNDFGPVTDNSFELDGRLERELTFSGELDDISPGLVWGVGAYLRDLPYTHLNVAFREIRSTEDDSIDQRRIAATFQQRIWDWLFVEGTASYDFFLQLANEYRGGLRIRPVEWFDGRVQYHYLLPSFSADSIFNVFSWRPINRVEGTGTFWLGEGLSVYAGGYASFLETDARAEGTTDRMVQDTGVNVGGRWNAGSAGSVVLDYTTQFGYGGDQHFVTAGTDWVFDGRRFGVDGRLLLILFDDQVQPNLEGTMFGAQAGGFWQFTPGGRLSILVEHATTELQPSWLRAMAMVDLNYWL
jgi:hypothetical protein